jgi:hypothetical protein
MPDIHVTFASEPLIGYVAQALPDHAEIGAQYDAVAKDGTTIYAVVWSYEQATEQPHAVYNPPSAWNVIDNMPAGAVTLPFFKALPTLADAFGLQVPCVEPK